MHSHPLLNIYYYRGKRAPEVLRVLRHHGFTKWLVGPMEESRGVKGGHTVLKGGHTLRAGVCVVKQWCTVSADTVGRGAHIASRRGVHGGGLLVKLLSNCCVFPIVGVHGFWSSQIECHRLHNARRGPHCVSPLIWVGACTHQTAHALRCAQPRTNPGMSPTPACGFGIPSGAATTTRTFQVQDDGWARPRIHVLYTLCKSIDCVTPRVRRMRACARDVDNNAGTVKRGRRHRR